MPRNLVLAASAGTGKTHALVGVILHLLLGGRDGGAVDPTKIVATTFSRKAAAEIRERVARELERLLTAPATSSYAEGLRETIGPNVRDEDLTKRARKAFARLPQARFGTLHSFATGIVQRYAVELGLGPGFELASEADARARAEDALAGALERRLGERSDDLRILVEAAGGIDRLVTSLRRVLLQLEEDGRSARDLELDANDARAVESQMRELTLHARAVAAYPKYADAARALASAWDSGAEDVIESASAALTAVPAHGKKPPEVEAFFAFRRELPGATNEERGRRLARSWRARAQFGRMGALVREILAEAESEIERVGRTDAKLGFGEILRAARLLLRDRPDVAAEVSATMEALLVDEFQDTSRVQRDLLQLLWARQELRTLPGSIPPLSTMRPKGLLVVGDRKQSIYGFRGADVGVFAELAVGLAGAPAREALGIPLGVTWEPKDPLADFHALRHNRRSVPAILSFANAFSARRFQAADTPPELFEIEYVPTTEDLLVPPERPAPSKAPATTWLRIAPKGASSTRLEEALVIGARVKQLLAERTPLQDIAILASTNGMLDAAAFALAQLDIPYVMAGKSFFRAREVSDLAAMLRLILEPADRLAAVEVLRGPWGGVRDETLLGLVETRAGIVPPDRWTKPPVPELIHPDDITTLKDLAALVLSLGRCAVRLSAGAILREAISARGLRGVLLAMPRGEQRVGNVDKLLSMADRHADARSFRVWLDDAKDQEVAESEAATFSAHDDAVRLLTIHASKGLDFKTVFVPEIAANTARGDKSVASLEIGMGEERNVLAVRVVDSTGLVLEPPSYLRAHANSKRRDRAERQRLAYVAVTRAAERLFLVGGRSRETPLDPGASTLGALIDMSSDVLSVEDVVAPEMSVVSSRQDTERLVAPELAVVRPAWRALPIAPTALADFVYCPRRFELAHVLGISEYRRTGRIGAKLLLDARTQGTLAHAVLESLSVGHFLSADRGGVETALSRLGVPRDHSEHSAITTRVLRFLESHFVRTMAAAGASLSREVSFVLPIQDAQGREILLGGSMDLVVVWPDESVDVIDYKSARVGDITKYDFQLAVYGLAALDMFGGGRRLRVGLSFLGSGDGEPIWHDQLGLIATRAKITAAGDELMSSRWSNTFPRVTRDRCAAIHCGYQARCFSREAS